MNYSIHGKNTVFIEGNGIIGHYWLIGSEVYKIVAHYSGDEIPELFHTIGELPLNTEARLLNELRERGEI